ncbi:SAV_915 family protein, partial [Streptomyces lasiicapitis]|uniref:SAV_915 family protein n=1 Tax=Streptomyces lasiicapitis TaxID=1923961 RepID=UPI003666210E
RWGWAGARPVRWGGPGRGAWCGLGCGARPGCVARLFRTPVGGRTAVAFTTPQRLADELGARQPWIRLSEPALRSLTEPLGVARVTVDPRLTPRTADPRLTPRTADSTATGHPSGFPAEARTSRTSRLSRPSGRPADSRTADSPDRRRVPALPAAPASPAAPQLTPTGPGAVAAFADTARRTSRWRDWDPQAVGALRVTGAAAIVGALTAWIG